MTTKRNKDYMELNGIEDICFFSTDKYTQNQIVCLDIDGLKVYEIYSIPKVQYTFTKTYYARQLKL